MSLPLRMHPPLIQRGVGSSIPVAQQVRRTTCGLQPKRRPILPRFSIAYWPTSIDTLQQAATQTSGSQLHLQRIVPCTGEKGPAMSTDQLSERKTEIRKAAHAARKAQSDKDAVSGRITDRVMQLPEYITAQCVMWYVDVRDEARTRHALPSALTGGKRIVIPYCVDGELELFHLQSMDELEIGMYKILEPRDDLRAVEDKRVDVKELDLILVPGVAFDARGGRTGHGKGYYDKLLENAKSETPLVALAFECQMFEEIPMQDHDIFMDKVVTEARVYTGIGRTA